jgi:hypothetical protein
MLNSLLWSSCLYIKISERLVWWLCSQSLGLQNLVVRSMSGTRSLQTFAVKRRLMHILMYADHRFSS